LTNVKGITMKTIELKRILREDCLEVFTESENAIYSVCWTVWKKERQLVVRRVIPLGVLTVLGKYHNTPINEREDEKKYQLKVNEFNKRIIGVDYIEQIKTTLKKTPEGNQKFIFDNKDIFTQSEIDNFPKEIKGAIECGFLRKVEVE